MGLITTGDGGVPDIGGQPTTPERLERRILDAALRCLARWGVAKTTLDDIARDADVSRATVYRAFPGGKDTVLDAVVADELARFGSELAQRLTGAEDLEALLVTGVTFASRTLTGHDALQYLLLHEPERVLPHVSFGRYDRVLAAAAQLVAPHLARFVGEGPAARTGEWVTRLILSYTLAPSPFYDLTDADDVRRFVRSYLLPGLTSTAPSATQP